MTEQSALWAPTETRAPVFRSIHYLGGKLRLVDSIREAVGTLSAPGSPVADLFAGSGVVAATLAHDRPVIAADIQEYSRVLCSALLRPFRFSVGEMRALTRNAERIATEAAARAALVLLHEDRCTSQAEQGRWDSLCEVIDAGSAAAYARAPDGRSKELAAALAQLNAAAVDSHRLTLTRYYGGVYFGYRQALELDALVEIAHRSSREKRDTLLAAVLSTASDAVATVGNHFAQPVRPRDGHGRPKHTTLAHVLRRRQNSLIGTFARWLAAYSGRPPAAEGRAVRADYRDFLAQFADQVSIVYADPPYTREHYSRFYHVLETIAEGDDPGLSATTRAKSGPSRGLYRCDRHQSPFCIKTRTPQAFRDLFAPVAAVGIPLVLSYSPYSEGTPHRPEGRLMTVEAICEMAGEWFSEVTMRRFDAIAHSKFNATTVNGARNNSAEVLILCQP